MEEVKTAKMSGIRAQSGPAKVPPEVLRSSFRTVANYFEGIRKDWLLGDQDMIALLSEGHETTSNGFAQIMRFEVRGKVREALQRVKEDSDFLPLVLPHCDPSLRDSIARMLRLLDLDSFQDDRYAENRERWRQSWPAMDLDGQLDELLLKLRAAGDALVVGTRESTAIPSEIVLRLEAAAKAIEIKQERTSSTHVDEPKRLVKVAKAAEVVSKRSDAVLRALQTGNTQSSG